MELFNEIDEFQQLLMKETSAKLDCDLEEFQDLESKYASLHESYSKEIENSKKVEKCLVKCLKFYSKLSKKYEAQQKIIIALEESVKEKVHSLEESLRTQEKLKGVIEVYRTERSIYAGVTHEDLRKDKKLLLDICCKLISASVKTDHIREIGNLILRKFKKDLDEDKVIKLLRLRHVKYIEKENKTSFETCTNTKDDEDSFNSDEVDVDVDDDDDDDDDDLISLEENKIDSNLTNKNNSLLSHNFENVSDKYKENNKFEVLDDKRKKENLNENKSDCKNDGKNSQFSQLEEAEVLKHNENKNETLKNESVNYEKSQFFDGTVKNNCTFKKVIQKNENLSLESNFGSYRNKKDCSSLQNNSNLKEDELLQFKDEKTTILDFNEDKNNINERICGDSRNDKKEEVELKNFLNEGGQGFTEETKKERSPLSDVITNSVTSPHAEKLSNVSKSIFDVPEVNVNSRNTLEPVEPLKLNFDDPVIEERKHLQKNVFHHTPNKSFSSTSSLESDEEDLSRIFRETSNVRLLSPIRDMTIVEKSILTNKKNEIVLKTNSSSEFRRKRSSCSKGESTTRSKKAKSDEFQTGFLDSIMSAMSQQNEEFKSSKKVVGESKTDDENKEENILTSVSCSSLEARPTYLTRKNLKENSFIHKSSGGEKDKLLEKVIMEELKKFTSCPMNSKEEADKSVKQCITVLRNKPEQIVARTMVAIVFENVDENVEVFERPAPPLTKTQHRLIVLLSVFKTVDPNSEKIPQLILNLIWEKLFPDKFFWPDDCVETATRFYTALCRSRNDTKTLWKFCLQAMTEMKQRCCLIVFTALKTWPDVLHDASKLQNNILASTVVNIFLHMPKEEGLRNFNQKKKLLALKHLLINFYQFKFDDTIETYTQKVFNAFWKEETGSEKALVLLAKCRDWNWTNKNVIIKLKGKLKEWTEGILGDFEGNKVLSVIKQICTVFLCEGESAAGQAKEIVSCLSTALNSGRLTHDTEQNIIQLLLQMKQYVEARTVIREWKPKEAINDTLRNEIINVSAENILRELKLNKKKDAFEKKKNSKLKKVKKKSKGKKRKGKKKPNKKLEVGCTSEL